MASGIQDIKSTLEEFQRFGSHVLEQCKHKNQVKSDLRAHLNSLQDAIKKGDMKTIQDSAASIKRVCRTKGVPISESCRQWLHKMEDILGGGGGGGEHSWMQSVHTPSASQIAVGGSSFSAGGGGTRPPLNIRVPPLNIRVHAADHREQRQPGSTTQLPGNKERLNQQLQQQDLGSLLEKNIELQKDLELKGEDLTIMKRRYEEVKGEADDLRELKDVLYEEIAQLKTEVAAKKENVQQLTSQMEKNNTEFTEHRKKAQERYKHDLKDRDNEIRDRDSQIKSLKAERDDLSTRYASLNVAAKRRTSLSTGSDALEKTITGSDSFPETQESQQLQKDIDKLKTELAKERKTRSVAENHYKQSLEDIHKRLTEKSMECETAQNEIEGYKRKMQRMKSAMSE